MIDLKIDQQFGRIGLDINKAKYDLTIKRPDIQVEQIPAEITLNQSPGELRIDYTPMLESLGLGGLKFIMSNFVQEAKEDFITNLEKSVSEGNALGAIEKNISVGEVSGKAAVPEEQEIEITALAPVKIHYEPMSMGWSVHQGGISVNVDRGEVNVDNFVFPSVQVFLEKEPYLKIRPVGQAIDLNK